MVTGGDYHWNEDFAALKEKKGRKVGMKNTLHLKAPGDWINDPNGFIYYQGRYHLFFQYFPCAPEWGTMHWGHAVSEDLIHWTHLGIALYPTKDYDRNGMFSGSALELDGKMYLYYTAVKYLKTDDDYIHHSVPGCLEQSQALLISEDGFSFDNRNAKMQIIPPIADENIGSAADCRDPKVWKEGEWYYMVIASTYQQKEGVLLLYRSEDGVNWSYLNRLQDKRLGNILECPDLFMVNDAYVLVSSPIAILKDTDYPENQSTCQLVSFDAETGEVTLRDSYQFLDYGMDLYAPQSNLDKDGRRVIISWVRMPEEMAPEDNSASGGRFWNGMMSLPRVVTVKEGHIYTAVHPNVRAYFEDACCEKINHDCYLEQKREGNSRICTTIKEGQVLNLDGYQIMLKDGCVCTDRSELLPKKHALHSVCKSPYVGEQCSLEIYLEQNLIEIFINDGQYVISNVIYR